MNQYHHIMLDLETLGLNIRRNFVILSVGAVAFNLDDIDTPAKISSERKLYCELNLEEQVEVGRVIEPGTVDWWMQQDAIARLVFSGLGRVNCNTFVTRFLDFRDRTVESSKMYLWGNGNVFDCMALRNYYEDFGFTFPFRWTRDMDLRTLEMMYGARRPAITHDGTEHNALDDAIVQAIQAQQMYRSITDGRKT